jgi:predicted dehydrogenase
MIHAAIVGLGRWGQVLVDSVQEKSEKIQFTRAITRTPAHAETFARDRRLILGSQLRDALADSAIEAVVLATPHSLHAQQIAQAAAAGKHVFVEKPFTLTKSSAQEAVQAAQSAGIVLALGHNRRFSPAVRDLQSRLDGGQLGIVVHAETNYSGPGAFRYQHGMWRADKLESPAGGMAGMGIHMVDGLIGLLGPICQVQALSHRRVLNVDIDDTTAVLLRFRSGATGYLGTIAATSPEWRMQIFGSRGWVELRDDSHLRARMLDREPEMIDFGPFDKERAELEAFADAICGETPYPLPLDQAVHGIAVFEAIAHSATTGHAVDIDSAVALDS